MKRVLLLALLCLLSACGGKPTTTPDPKPDPDPTSALGDSPTLTGTIANLAEAELDTSALTIKALIITKDSEEKVIAQGTVSSSGVFSIKLPGVSVLESDLKEIPNDPRPFQYTCTGFVAEPDKYKITRALLKLYSNGQPVEADLPLSYSSNGGLNQVLFTFVDRDVVSKADCVSEDSTTNIDQDLKKGWNTSITTLSSDQKQTKIFSAVPDSSFKWLIFILK